MRRRVLSALLLGVALAATPAAADPLPCRVTLLQEAAKHARAVLSATEQCEKHVLAGTLPATTDCLADPGSPAALASAGRARARMTKACCGVDGVCGTPDDDLLAAVGWSASTCPDFESAPCTGPTTDADGVATCLACADEAAVDQLREIMHDRLTASSPGSTLQQCQLAIAKAGAHFFATKSKLLAKCWARRAAGLHANPCPDPGDGKAAPGIARAAAAVAKKICAACGGADRVCGGGDDLTPAAIGFVGTCPALTVPGAASCARPVATLADVAACVGCIADFTTDCADRLAVPEFASYPPECTPPPATCAAGVTCETSVDCPGGYQCRDNGGGARYCVGAACAGDGECGGGGVCRQYCTLAGCDVPRCQCPGFGCTGADELCFRDGDLACRKICSQDSDCVDPFGFVCVNPGFGLGLCIASVPCQ